MRTAAKLVQFHCAIHLHTTSCVCQRVVTEWDCKELHGHLKTLLTKSEFFKGENAKYLIMILAAFVLIGKGVMNALICIAMHADINAKDTADDIFCGP